MFMRGTTCVNLLWFTSQVLDICSVSSPDAVFALRVRVTQYPEGLISVWLMLAVKHAGG